MLERIFRVTAQFSGSLSLSLFHLMILWPSSVYVPCHFIFRRVFMLRPDEMTKV